MRGKRKGKISKFIDICHYIVNISDSFGKVPISNSAIGSLDQGA